ncbi:MSHA biogenesis protein MshK [Vibrio furnissii]|uniref:MSHA biogenesis protein MshK n=1 Tax=Vibrio furnissii TaxID=29494 RepID=UPI0015591ECD|nr:MSHA biogenesis protein MshK [Vibrio furnissii]WHR50932.1 MSHA biogenesis protein MshK [Vibrio furnissii]
MVKAGVLLGALLCSTTLQAAEDPTAPLGYAPSQVQKKARQYPLPELQSIICQQQCSAIVNDQLVAAGDSIRGYQVAKVTPSTVTLVRGGQRWELELFSLNIKN